MKEYLAFTLLACVAEAAWAQSACSTLSDLVAAGISRSDAIKIKSAETSVADAQLRQARAAVLPSIDASGSLARQDQSPSSSKANQEGWQSTAKISVTQPLYAGGAEYAALRKAKLLTETSRLEAEAEKLSAARDVVSRYYDLLTAQSELRSITELRDVSRRRAKDIQSRVAIGRSRAADGRGAEAQVASVEAQHEAARLDVDSARRALASLTGQPVTEACDRPYQAKLTIKSWEEVAARISDRPDIVAAAKSGQIAKEAIEVSRAGNMPSLALGANYYLKRPESQKSLGNWDVALSASLPLYSGGMVSAKVNELEAQASRQNLQAQILKTAALDQAREYWEAYAASKTQLASLQLAADKSAEYYKMMSQDEIKGLASSLEALQALNASIDARRAAEKAKLRADEAWRQILLLAGTMEGVAQ